MFRRWVLQLLVVLAAVFTSAAAAWANDTFPGTVLTGTSGTVVGTTVGATGQASENTTYGGGSLNTIWYSWTAPSTGRFTAAMCNMTGDTNPNFDTTLIAYTGAAFPLTVVSTNDDATGCNTSATGNYGSVVSFNVTAGTTYRLQVDGYASATGTYTLRWGMVGLTVATTDNSATEGGDTATFTVVLNAPPAASPPGGNNMAAQSATVTIGTSTQCTFAPAALTFTTTNWNIPQTVTATAIDDILVEGTHSCAPATITAAGGTYGGITATPPTLVVNDNENPSFTISKSASAANISAPGTITYTITVDNNGSALLTAPVISDSLTLGGSPLTLTSGPTLSSGDTNSNGQLEDTETWVYTATNAVTQANLDTGGTFSNTATFDTAQTAPSTSSAATTAIVQSPSFALVKSQSGGANPVTAAGQSITYSIAVANSGNISLTGLTISDTFQLGGSARTLTSGPAYASGDTNSDGKISVGETWIYAASYTVTQADVDGTGSFSNTATFDTAQTAPSTSNTVTTNVTRTPRLAIAKSWNFANPGDDADGDGRADKNDVVTYYYAVTNTGNVTVSNVVINDVHLGAGTPPVPLGELITGDVAPAADSTDTASNNGTWSFLKPGDTVTFRGTYLVTQGDIDHG